MAQEELRAMHFQRKGKLLFHAGDLSTGFSIMTPADFDYLRRFYYEYNKKDEILTLYNSEFKKPGNNTKYVEYYNFVDNALPRKILKKFKIDKSYFYMGTPSNPLNKERIFSFQLIKRWWRKEVVEI